MSKSSYVLRALKILGLEEMLKLSEVLLVKQIHPKKAAGGELIVWDEDDAPQKPLKKAPQEDAKVLPFSRKSSPENTAIKEEAKTKPDEPSVNTIEVDALLWQRELAKQTGENAHKKEAIGGYKKATEMYVIKTPTLEGKDKIRFASTNGVLVNKKQA